MGVGEAGALQPAPAQEFSLLGQAAPLRGDYSRVWWHVPGAAGARAVLLPPLAITAGFAVIAIPMGREIMAVFFAIALVFAAPYFLVWLLGEWFTRRRFARVGRAPVQYRIDEVGVTLAHASGEERHAWSSLRAFLQVPHAFVLYPRRGSVIVLPLRAFTAGAEHLAWVFRRRLEERSLPRWGQRSAFWAAGVVAFLGLWHFFSMPTAEEVAAANKATTEPQLGEPSAPSDASAAGASPSERH